MGGQEGAGLATTGGGQGLVIDPVTWSGGLGSSPTPTQPVEGVEGCWVEGELIGFMRTSVDQAKCSEAVNCLGRLKLSEPVTCRQGWWW